MSKDSGLDEIVARYERSEVTLLWEHNRKTDKNRILFAAVEMCPREQPRSDPFGELGIERVRLRKEDSTLYVGRCFNLDPVDALTFYRGLTGARSVRLDDGTRKEFEPIEVFGEDPANEHPLVVQAESSAHVYGVLPRRMGMRVCSIFARADRAFAEYDRKQRNILRQFSTQKLGFDLARHYEHFGAVHLLLPNPILRGWNAQLAGDDRAILFEFHERDGESVAGCAMRITDVRPGGIGIDRSFPLTSARMVLPTAYPITSLTYRLYDPYGALLEQKNNQGFINRIGIRMLMGHGSREVREKDDESGIERTHHVQVFSDEHHKVEPPPVTLESFLKEASSSRKDSPRFKFFPRDSAANAKAHLREILRNASERVMLCDPYFRTENVEAYLYFVKIAELPISVLGSAAILRKNDPAASKSQGELLHMKCQATRNAGLSLNIEVRVMRGKQSPIHDRFLIVDSIVYVLGSSLSNFGSRATTCFRAPKEAKVFSYLDAMWKESPHLDRWLKERDDNVAQATARTPAETDESLLSPELRVPDQRP